MSNDHTQTYESHRQLVPAYHFFLTALLLVLTVAAVVIVVRAFRADAGVLLAMTVLGIVVALHTMALLMRVFALRAQDRAIHAQVNFRHYVATGRELDPRITIRQAIGLRFAGDEEFVALAQQAAETGLSEAEIKKAITTWRPDTYRV